MGSVLCCALPALVRRRRRNGDDGGPQLGGGRRRRWHGRGQHGGLGHGEGQHGVVHVHAAHVDHVGAHDHAHVVHADAAPVWGHPATMIDHHHAHG